jgi:hypothetical protein
MADLVRTGSVLYRDEEGKLHKAESFVDPDTQVVSTVDTVEEEPGAEPSA